MVQLERFTLSKSTFIIQSRRKKLWSSDRAWSWNAMGKILVNKKAILKTSIQFPIKPSLCKFLFLWLMPVKLSSVLICGPKSPCVVHSLSMSYDFDREKKIILKKHYETFLRATHRETLNYCAYKIYTVHWLIRRHYLQVSL